MASSRTTPAHHPTPTANQIIASKMKTASSAAERTDQLATFAQKLSVPIASHDDDLPEKIDLVAAMGAFICKFAMDMRTARAAQSRGLSTLYGAPNVLRGKSQSGAMRALDAVIEGVTDCLCGDYSPASLLPSVLRLPELAGIALHEAIALVTCNPARAAGLHDRGSIRPGIRPGMRADLVAVKSLGGLAQADRVWVHGVPALTAHFDHA